VATKNTQDRNRLEWLGKVYVAAIHAWLLVLRGYGHLKHEAWI